MIMCMCSCKFHNSEIRFEDWIYDHSAKKKNYEISKARTDLGERKRNWELRS